MLLKLCVKIIRGERLSVISRCCWMVQWGEKLGWARQEPREDVREQKQNCHGPWGSHQGGLKKPRFVHPTGGLWGIRDEGPIKGCVLPVWAETPLKSLALHQCHCPTAHTQTLELLPVVPSKEFFWPKSFYFPSSAPASVQGSSESQGDVETTAGSFYPSVSSLWSSTTSCCSCASTGPLLLLFYSAISPLDYVLSAPTGCPQAQQTLVGASKEGKGDVIFPFCNLGTKKNISHEGLIKPPVLQCPKDNKRIPPGRDLMQLLFPSCSKILFIILLWTSHQWFHLIVSQSACQHLSVLFIIPVDPWEEREEKHKVIYRPSKPQGITYNSWACRSN